MISKFSAKKPYTVFVGVVMIIVLGVVSLMKMSADLLPNISLPYVMIMTTYAGASPETVETVITKPIESTMATVSNIEGIMSMSGDSYSMVAMEFAQTTNMDSISLEISEKLDQIESYWDDDAIGTPIVMKMNPDMLPIMIAAVGKEDMSAAEISEFVQNDITPRLESIEGVASVTETGLISESVHVIIRQEKIDKINEQVFGYIDGEMLDAQKDIDEGREDLDESVQDIYDNIADLDESQADLDESQQELYDSWEELEEQRDEAEKGLKKLKKGEKELKKAQEAIIAELSSKLQMREDLEETIPQVKEQLEAAEAAYNALSSYENQEEFTMDEFNSINSILRLNTDDITDADGDGKVDGEGNSKIQDKIAEIIDNYLEGKAQLKQMEDGLAELKKSIGALEAAQMEAAIEFGSQKAQLDMGKAQLESADEQFEAAEEQLVTGQESIDDAKEQLNEARTQIDDAWEKIDDAKEQLDEAQEDLDEAWDNALLNADMHGILTVETVKQLLAAQNFSMPAGYVEENGFSYMVRVGDKPDNVDKLKAMPLMNMNMDGVDIITLEDVADVFMTDNSKDVYTNVNGSAGVMLSLQKQTGYSTGDVADLINEEFADILEEEEGVTILTLMDQGIYIDMVMDSIMNNILLGGALAILVLIFFLKDIRPTLIIAVSIPVSVIAAVVCMYFSGVTLNIISLSGLALGIGMLVDNSIVVIENIYRLRNEGYSMMDAAVEGAREVAGAITASTLTTVCVFAPIIFTEGITRQLFVDMGLTIAYSLGASLVIALTVVPAMAGKMLKKIKVNNETGVFNKLSLLYSKTIPVALRFKWLVLLITIVMLVLSTVLSVSKGTAFMPSMDSTQLSVRLETIDEYNLQDTVKVSNEIIERIQKIEDVADVGAMSGTSSMLSTDVDPNIVEMYVTLHEDKTHTAVEVGKLIEEATADIKDITLTVSAEAMDMSALTGSGVTIYVKGRDLDTIQELAKEVAAVVETVEGTTEVEDGLEESSEELRIIVDRDKAMDCGLTVAQVFSQINTKITEDTGSVEMTTDTKEYDIFVIHQANQDMSREDIKNMMIDYKDKDSNARKIALSEIANFENAMSFDTVNRINQTRYVTVTAAIAEGYNVGLVSADVQEALKDFELPNGYVIEFEGENEMIMDAMEQLMLMMILAIIFMFLIMVAQFQSLKSPFIILFTIPLAFTGGFLGLYCTNSEVSVISVIGFVMLAGIIVNNGIVLVDYINQLRADGMEKKAAIAEAGRTRLRPVIMTALTTILSMSTMMFSKDMGADMSKPMAIVIVGGLVYGTLLTLYVVPCIYDIFNKEKKMDELVLIDENNA